MRKLTHKREAFIDALFINGFNATQAYKTAYPNCNGGWDRLGPRLMRYDEIKQAIATRKVEIQAKMEYNYEQAICSLNVRLGYLEAKANAGDVQAIQAQTAILREKNEITGLHKQIIKREETVPVLAEEERQVLAVLASQYKAGLARSAIKVVRETG